MFNRFTSRLNFKFALNFKSTKTSTLFLKSAFTKKNNITLPALLFTSYCSYSFFQNSNITYNSSAETQIDPIDAIQAKCASFSTKEEEAKLIEYLKKHLEHYRKLKGEKSDEVGVILMQLASHCIAGTGEKLDGIRYGEQSCDIFLETDEDKTLFLDQLDDLAGMALQVSKEESIRLHQKTLDLKIRYKGKDFPGTILNYLALGELYMIQNDKQKSESNFEEAKKLLETIKLTEDPENVFFEACEKFHTANKFTESNGYCQKALSFVSAIKERDGDLISQEGRTIDLLAQNALALGEPETGIQYLLKLNEFLEKNLKEKSDPYYFGKGQNSVKIGNIYFDQKKFDSAISNFQEALSHFEKVKQNGDVLIYITKRTMSDVYAEQQEYQKAFEALAGAYEAAKKTFGENHPNTKNDLILLEQLKKRGYKLKEEENKSSE